MIGTEIEIVRALQKEFPQKKFYEAKEAFICEDMKKNTLETLLKALQEEKEEILLDDQTLLLARKALENMINL
jgi:quinolinate synthase